MSPSLRPGALATYVASVLLAIALLTAGVLLFLLTLRPAPIMTVAVGGQQATGCPAGAGAPACFRFDVTNTGTRDGTAACFVTSAPSTTASFINGSTVAQVLLKAGEVKQVYLKVSPDGGGDTVFAPTLECDPN
ncbi:MAG: hypothetical protein WD096_09415 [Actinomycetota bacterium]